jgi:PhnB protein
MKIDPYLVFDGTCEQAMTFYAAALGGEVVMMNRFAQSPGCEDLPPERIMHARVHVGDQVLMASDSHPAHGYDGIKGFSIALNVESPEQAQRSFQALAEGGTVVMPLGETFWSESFGMLIDRFGVSWMVNLAKPGF